MFVCLLVFTSRQCLRDLPASVSPLPRTRIKSVRHHDQQVLISLTSKANCGSTFYYGKEATLTESLVMATQGGIGFQSQHSGGAGRGKQISCEFKSGMHSETLFQKPSKARLVLMLLSCLHPHPHPQYRRGTQKLLDEFR